MSIACYSQAHPDSVIGLRCGFAFRETSGMRMAPERRPDVSFRAMGYRPPR